MTNKNYYFIRVFNFFLLRGIHYYVIFILKFQPGTFLKFSNNDLLIWMMVVWEIDCRIFYEWNETRKTSDWLILWEFEEFYQRGSILNELAPISVERDNRPGVPQTNLGIIISMWWHRVFYWDNVDNVIQYRIIQMILRFLWFVLFCYFFKVILFNFFGKPWAMMDVRGWEGNEGEKGCRVQCPIPAPPPPNIPLLTIIKWSSFLTVCLFLLCAGVHPPPPVHYIQNDNYKNPYYT